jgi:quinol monooxygenase YgiN
LFDTEQAEVVRTYLPEQIRTRRAEPGCLSFNVDPTDDPLIWRLDQNFATRDAYDAHQTRTRASAWYAATTNLNATSHSRKIRRGGQNRPCTAISATGLRWLGFSRAAKSSGSASAGPCSPTATTQCSM